MRVVGKIKVNIFGSCVSRDMLEYDAQKQFCIGEYIARQSIISFLSAPVEFDEKNIQLNSCFQARQVESDLKKNALIRLKSSEAECMIIDLIEERFNIGKVKGSYITLSNEFNQSEVFKNEKIRIYEKKIFYGKVYFNHRDIKKYIEQFAKKILEIYSQNQIVIHEVYLANYYLGEDGVKREFSSNYVGYNLRINQILEYMYGHLKQKMPDAHIISISKEYVADEKHKWGLMPMHFQEEYYREAVNQLYNYK